VIKISASADQLRSSRLFAFAGLSFVTLFALWAELDAGENHSADSERRGTVAYSAPLPEEYQQPLPSLPTDQISKLIAKRAEARWAALVSGQFEGAYIFEDPKYRSEKSASGYRGQYGPYVQWHDVEVVRLEYPSEGEARVGVNIDYSFLDPNGGGTPVRITAFAWEKWKKVEDQWWHQPKWGTLSEQMSAGTQSAPTTKRPVISSEPSTPTTHQPE